MRPTVCAGTAVAGTWSVALLAVVLLQSSLAADGDAAVYLGRVGLPLHYDRLRAKVFEEGIRLSSQEPLTFPSYAGALVLLTETPNLGAAEAFARSGGRVCILTDDKGRRYNETLQERFGCCLGGLSGNRLRDPITIPGEQLWGPLSGLTTGLDCMGGLYSYWTFRDPGKWQTWTRVEDGEPRALGGQCAFGKGQLLVISWVGPSHWTNPGLFLGTEIAKYDNEVAAVRLVRWLVRRA